jgi:hypothetical protein
MSRRFRLRTALFFVIVATLGVSACGRRGDLEPAASAAVQKPNNGQPEFHKSVPKIVPPKQSFALDPLLQ